MAKAVYKRKGLFVAYSSRGMRIYYHHGEETWQQADTAARTAADIAHLQPQTRSRKSELEMAGSFRTSKSTSSDAHHLSLP